MPTYTWSGAGSDNNWDTSGNWGIGNPPPGSSDTATLDPVSLSASLTVTVTNADFVSAIAWNTSSTQTATIDITSGGYLTVGATSGTAFTGDATGATIELENVGNGSTLQIGIGNSALTGGITGGVGAAVVFANNGSGSATVYWDSVSKLLPAKHDLSLTDFNAHDTLEVLGGSVSNESYSGGVLSFTAGGRTEQVTLIHTSATDYNISDFTFSSDGTNVFITSSHACFLRGTRIATLRGEVAVEDLSIGDLVVTTGGALPIKWIGTRGFVTSLLNEHNRAATLPVRIAAGALDEAVPVRDLHVSPEHMMCLDDVLIPAGELVNGTTITRAGNIEVVEYFHIELPRHAVLYAEGAPAESFLDSGNRNVFTNVLSYAALGYGLDAPRQPACLPVVTGGEALAAVRARLAERAARAVPATTEDDNLHLLVDGAELRPTQRDGDTVRFTVPAGAQQVRIVSRTAVPAEFDPANGDLRSLGVCFFGLSLRDGSFALDLAPSYAGLADGFHADEGGHRWTNGDALLPVELTAAMPDGFVLDLRQARTGLRYPAPAGADAIPARRPAAPVIELLSA